MRWVEREHHEYWGANVVETYVKGDGQMSNIKIEDMQYFSDNWYKLYAVSFASEDTALSTFCTIVGGMPGSFTKLLTDIKSMSNEQLLALRYKIINEDLTPMEVLEKYADSAYRNE